MKILLISDYATPIGGAELMMLSLRDGLKQRGHDARFFASSAQPSDLKSLADYECLGTTSSFRTLLQTANPWAFFKLKQVLEEFQPDVVHVRLFLTQLSPLILLLLKNVPSLYHVAWYRAICPLGTKMLPNGKTCSHAVGVACYKHGCLPLHDWVLLMLQMRLWKHWRNAFNLIVANSQAVKHRLVEQEIEPVEVVWNGIPIHLARSPLKSLPTVAFAGRLVREKGVDILIQSFAKVILQIPDAMLLIAGEGKEQDRIILLIKELQLQNNVIILGYLPRLVLEEKLASAWVQVVPSRWAEPFGIVATEAMMRGTAVIASDTGGLKEIVWHNQTGFLIPPENIDALADALFYLLSDRNLAESMGKKAREVALKYFTEEHFVNQFIELYHKIS
jgi:glycosyltransferase involved in cell wall biosynthesis